MTEPQQPANVARPDPQGLFASIKRESLSWIGVGGAVITLLTGIQDFIKLATWAAVLVDNFSHLTLWVWSKVFFFLPKLTPLAGWFLNLLTFFVTVAFSSVRWGATAPTEKEERKSIREVLIGLGLAFTFGLAVASFAGLYSTGGLAASDYDFIRSYRDWIGSFVPAQFVITAGMLILLLPLVLLMNALGWSSRFLGGRADKGLAVSRIWRINLGVVLVLALSAFSKLFAPLCDTGGALNWLCG